MCKVKNVLPVIILTILMQFFTPYLINAENSEKLTILYTNSLDGNIDGCNCVRLPKGGLVKRGAFLEDYRKRNSDDFLFVDGGDFFPKTVDPLKSKYLIKAMNYLKYDAIGIGDQEFTNGIDAVYSYISNQDNFISSNLEIDGKPIKQEIIKRIGNTKVGIFSLLHTDVFKDYPEDVKSRIKILDPVTTANTCISDLKNEGATVILLISHMGYENEKALIEKVSGIDFILSSHDGVLFNKDKPNQYAGSYFLSAGSEGFNVGKLTATVSNGKLRDIQNELIPVPYSKWEDDPQIRNWIKEYEKECESSSDIVPSEFRKDLGEIESENIILGDFYISNKGTLPLDVKLTSGCDCLSLDWEKKTVMPNTREYVNYTLDTKDLSGDIERSIVIESTAPENPISYYTINAQVKKRGGSVSKTDSKPKQLLNESTGKIDLYTFGNCESCLELKKTIILPTIEKSGIQIDVEIKDLLDSKVYEEFSEIRKLYPQFTELPVLIVGEEILSGKAEIKEKLSSTLQKVFIEDEQFTIEKQKESIKSGFTYAPALIIILLAGLIDGINPCAFMVIIVFLTFLIVRVKKRKELLIAGFSYIISVFITYFLTGLGLFSIIKSLAVFQIFHYIFKWGLSAVLIILAGLSLYDYYLVRRGEPNEMLLQLPLFIKRKIRREFDKKMGRGTLIITPLILGFTVSFLELACTGQIYLPVLVYMLKSGTGIVSSLSKLVIYNIFFILPLLLLFLAVYFGLNSQKIKDFFASTMGFTKAAIAILFLLLAVVNFII